MLPSNDPSGATDTVAAQAVLNAGKELYLDSGDFVFNGPLNPGGYHSVKIRGNGPGLTRANLTGSFYFFDTGQPADAIMMEGVRVNGGLGGLRFTSTGALDECRKRIAYCRFDSYTQCAINTNHADNPYWDIIGNTFNAASSVGTMGIALSANSDDSCIHRNAFWRNAVHIKLKSAGHVSICDNDFLQYDDGTKRVFVWLTGAASFNPQTVANILRNKMGNEHQTASDYRIALLPELAGTSNGDRLPDFSQTSMAGWYQVIARHNLIAGATGGGPIVYSAAYTLTGSIIADNVLNGAVPSKALQYANGTSVANQPVIL